jgi:hypothetical protein
MEWLRNTLNSVANSTRYMQLVFEFGSRELDPILEAIQHTIGEAEYAMCCLPTDSEAARQTTDTLAEAASKLRAGIIRAFTQFPQNEVIRYVLVTRPFFDGQQRSLFLGTIEHIGNDYRPLWNMLLEVPGLSVVCVGFEEGLELEDKVLSVESFPWNEWPLVIGALRLDQTGVGPWEIREGPEMKWFR